MDKIKYMKGSIFDSTADVLVCPVNVHRAMGAGLAKQFKERWPALNRSYIHACQRELRVRHPWLWLDEKTDKRVLCFPTKDHWKDPSQLSYIRDGLRNFRRGCGALKMIGADHIAFPRLGCGLGGLAWEGVKKVMEYELGMIADYGFTIEIWEADGG